LTEDSGVTDTIDCKRPTADGRRPATTQPSTVGGHVIRRFNRYETYRYTWSIMEYKFQRLEIYKLSLEYVSLTYALSDKLPTSENFNLKSQLVRAATSVTLNIAEGSTSQSDAEQARFLGLALRSLVETIACHDIILTRNYGTPDDVSAQRQLASKLFAKIQSMKKFLGQHNAMSAKPGRKTGDRRPLDSV